MDFSKTSWIVLSGVLIASAGCSSEKTGTVSGVVQIDGKPLGGFFVCYSPVGGGGAVMGAADQAGKYKLFRGRGREQIPVGEYRVYLQPTGLIEGVPAPSVKLDRQYTDYAQASLVKTINTGANEIDIEIPSRGKN